MKKLLLLGALALTTNLLWAQTHLNYRSLADSAYRCALNKGSLDSLEDCSSAIFFKELFQVDTLEGKKNIQLTVERLKSLDIGLRVNAVMTEAVRRLNQGLIDSTSNYAHYRHSENGQSVANYERATTFFEKKRYKKAIKYYQLACQADSTFAKAFDQLAISYRHTESYGKALKAYQQSLKIQPDGNIALMNMGLLARLGKAYPEAIALYEALSIFHPCDPEGPYGLAIVYFNLGQAEAALPYLITAYGLYEQQGQDEYQMHAYEGLASIYADMAGLGREGEFRAQVKQAGLRLDFLAE